MLLHSRLLIINKNKTNIIKLTSFLFILLCVLEVRNICKIISTLRLLMPRCNQFNIKHYSPTTFGADHQGLLRCSCGTLLENENDIVWRF